MKDVMKILFLWGMLCVSLAVNAQQDYLSMLKVGRSWYVESIYDNENVVHYYKVEGKEIFDDREYYLIHKAGYSHPAIIFPDGRSRHFEKDDKVYLHKQDESNIELFDFTLKVGDSPSKGIPVMAIETIEVCGIPYRCIKLGLWNYYDEPLYWIEGIGSTWRGPFGDFWDPEVGVPGTLRATKLKSVWDGDECIFDIDEFHKARTATGLESISYLPRNSKSSSALYDLQGRRLMQKPTKGVYIQDGKKVAVK